MGAGPGRVVGLQPPELALIFGITCGVMVLLLGFFIIHILMIVLADHVATFLQKNRMYEVLGLFILFIVGIMLLTEGAHLAHLHLFGHEVTAMTKTTFYFVIAVLVLVDIVQTRYQKKLLRLKQAADVTST